MTTTHQSSSGAVALARFVIERGFISREELNAFRDGEAGQGARGVKQLAEALLRGGFMNETVLEELLGELERDRTGDAEGAETPPAATDPHAETRELLTRTVTGEKLVEMLTSVRFQGGDELLLVPGHRPALRDHEGLVPLDDPVISGERIGRLVAEAFTPEELQEVALGRALEKVFEDSCGRFRLVLTPSRQGMSLTCRTLNSPLGERFDRLPATLSRFAELARGLVVVASARASDRRDVLAQLVGFINERSRRHVITIEREIIFEHPTKRSLIVQREVGTHAESYAQALRQTLREDPDVIVVGELGEPEAIAMALLAAETGHLVLCSLHARTEEQALRRLIDAQTASMRNLCQATLANILEAVIVVDLLPGLDLQEHLVADVLPRSPTVARLIREDRLHQLPSLARSAIGATTRDDAILKLLQSERISRETALERLRDKDLIDGVAGGAGKERRTT